jgi:hypothetical protein
VENPDALSTTCEWKEEWYEKQKKFLIKGVCDIVSKSDRVQNL